MVNVAVAGVGVWGKNIVRNFCEIDKANLFSCYDLKSTSLRWVKENYPEVKIVDKYEEILKDRKVDAIVIATPPHTHFELARRALEWGKNVLVEKPLTLSSRDASTLVELAQKKDKKLMVGHLLKYHPAMIKVKEMIEKGELGKIFYIYSQRLNPGRVRKVENVMWCLATHDIYLVVYFLGSYPQRVNAFGKSFLQKEKGIEDVVFLTLFFNHEIFSHLHVSWFHPEKVRETKIIGEKKMLVFDEANFPYRLRICKREIDIGKQSDDELDFQIRKEDEFFVEVEKKQPLKEECLHFIECIEEDKTPFTDGEEGFKVVKVLEAAQKSLKEGKEIKVCI